MFVHSLFNYDVSCSVVRTAISAISKYHIIDANTRNTIGQHPLVKTAMKAFWQSKPLVPRHHGTNNINIILRFIENMGHNETLTLKQLSKKTACLVAFSTLSRYCLALTWANSVSLYIFISPFSLTVLLRVSSISVLVVGLHDRSDGAVAELVSLEKVTSLLY